MPSKARLVLCRQFSDAEDELIGDQIRVLRMSEETRGTIWKQNEFRLANWDLFYGQYTHVISNTYDPSTKSDEEAEQEIIRAFVLLKIMQSHTSGMHLVVDAVEHPGGVGYWAASRVGIGTASYVCASDINNWVTKEHIRQSRPMWAQIQKVCTEWQKYRRVLRAIRFFETASSNYDGGIRLIHLYSSLETLLCTSTEQVGQQLRQRVLAIHPCGVSAQDLKRISVMRAGLVHSGAIAEEARGKEEELIQKLERVVRATLYHALSDSEALALFSDERLIRERYPVRVKKFIRKETDVEISV
jgi:hypothetical protein